MMARKFYTPLSLTGLELQNFTIQNLADNPSPYGKGHTYYNTVANEIRVYDGTAWVAVGGSVEYGTYSAIPAAGNAGRVYVATDTQTLYFDNGSAWLQIGTSGTATYVNSVNGTSNQISVSQTTGDVTVSLPSYIDVTNGEFHLKKNEYWLDETQYGVVTANSYSGNFNVVAVGRALELETQSSGNIILNSASGIIDALNSELHLRKTEYWYGGDQSGTQEGIVAAISDGTFHVTATNNNLVLESNNGWVTLGGDSGVESLSNFQTTSGNNITSGNNLYVKNGIYAGGTDTSTDGYLYIKDASGNNLVALSGTNGSGVIETHGTVNLYRGYNDNGNQYGSFYSDSDTNLIISANNNNIVLVSDSSHSYIGSVSSGNQIATISDIHNIASGLYVLGSVKAASDDNIDLTSPITTVIGGVELNNTDRVLVKAQTDATQNGIYVFDGGTNMLVLSTNPEDTALKEGSYTLVEEGTHAAQGWIITSYTASASTWTQFSAAGEYTQGNGISISDGVISAVVQGTQGMALTSSGIAVNNGTGLEFNGSTGALQVIDYTSLTKKYATSIGDGTSTSFDITHNLDTEDVVVTIYDATTKEEVFADVTHANNSKVTVVFAVAPSSNAFRVVVVG